MSESRSPVPSPSASLDMPSEKGKTPKPASERPHTARAVLICAALAAGGVMAVWQPAATALYLTAILPELAGLATVFVGVLAFFQYQAMEGQREIMRQQREIMDAQRIAMENQLTSMQAQEKSLAASVAAAVDNAAAARDMASIAMMAEGAFVQVNTSETWNANNQTGRDWRPGLVWHLCFINAGKTVAQVSSMNVTFSVFENGVVDHLTSHPNGQVYALNFSLAAQFTSGQQSVRLRAAPDAILFASAGQEIMALLGRVTYMDIFGGVYETGFAYELNRSAEMFTRINNRFLNYTRPRERESRSSTTERDSSGSSAQGPDAISD